MGQIIEDHNERQSRKQEVLDCMREDNWKGVLEHFNRPNEGYREPLLVWIRPSVEAIKFIEYELKRLIFTTAYNTLILKTINYFLAN